MYALYFTSLTHIWRGNYAVATPQDQELIRLAEEKGALIWKCLG